MEDSGSRNLKQKFKRTGFVLFVGGIIASTISRIFQSLTDNNLLSLKRLGTILTLLGILSLFLYVLIDRLAESKHDPYKEVNK